MAGRRDVKELQGKAQRDGEREKEKEKGRKCKGAEEEIGEKCGAGRQVRRMKKK